MLGVCWTRRCLFCSTDTRLIRPGLSELQPEYPTTTIQQLDMCRRMRVIQPRLCAFEDLGNGGTPDAPTAKFGAEIVHPVANMGSEHPTSEISNFEISGL